MVNKVPPPMLTVLAVILVYCSARFIPFGHIDVLGQDWIGTCVFTGAIIIMAYAAFLFKRAKTTVNPFRPEQASVIIDTGIYRLSRNPMYLAMALIIGGASLKWGQGLGFLILAGFIIYMTETQIKPEERALAEKFGAPYIDYTNTVRRWI